MPLRPYFHQKINQNKSVLIHMKKILIVVMLIIAHTAQANIALPAVLSSNMVLQQQSSVKLWGWGNPGEKVRINPSWNNHLDSAVVTGDGKWLVSVTTPKAGGPYTIEVKGNNTITLTNILIGEVWVCSGQSNMEYNYYWGLEDVKAELPLAANPNIRFFNIPRTTALYPQEDCRAQWLACDSNTLKSFSAVGYFFGKRLNKELNVPIGLINASWGGTPAETWTPAEVVNGDSILNKAAGQQNSSKGWPTKPGLAFNGMIAPITHFDIAGSIWYQGESNTATAKTYGILFQSLITAWRSQWSKSFPFYYVQIAPFKYGTVNEAALLREEQAKALQLPNTGMAVIYDLVEDTNDIHPKNKHDVGLRLANLALANTYHMDVPYKSPIYKQVEMVNNKAIVSFDNVVGGLIVNGKAVKELYLAGPDRVFYLAESTVKNGQLIVWSKSVKQPVAVRYAFSNTALGNLFSKEGLPVAPFRTDNWNVGEALHL
jgi:sialate O-acetylesterase